MLHCTLSKVPEDLPWETLISKAGDYFIQFPPSELAAEAEWIYQKVSSLRMRMSVLKKVAFELTTKEAKAGVYNVEWHLIFFPATRRVALQNH